MLAKNRKIEYSMGSISDKSVFDFIYNGVVVFSAKEYEHFRRESKSLLVTPLKVMSLLIAVSGLFAMIFEVRYFSEYSVQVYVTRLLATLISFLVLVSMFTKIGKNRPIFLVHLLLAVIIISSGYMILLMPSTLVVNAQIVGLMIFTSALFLSWDVKNQIIVAIYYNLVFAGAILINNKSIYFLPHMYESVIFVLFLSVISVVGSAVNFKLRMQLAERSFKVELSEKKFHSIFENLSEGIFQSSLEGKFLTANPALAKILGYKDVDELLMVDIGKNIYKNVGERDKLIEELKENGSVINRIITLKKKDGADVIVSLNDRLVYDDSNKLFYFEGNLEDITEQIITEEKRKKAEEALRDEKLKSDQLAKEATKSTMVKSQFLANMSHEIRTPMNGILGFLTLIERGTYKDREELKQFSSIAHQSAELLLEIINDILDISKIESGKMILENTDFNLGDVVEETVSLLLNKANEKGLTVKTNIAEESILLLNGDPTRLRQIFLNLLSNAIKFTEKGTIKINISAKEFDGKNILLSVSVEDQGIGIAKDKIDQLFQPFTQADGSHTRRYGGTGLGLVICKEFVTMMGGKIGVESEEGKGSKFYFSVKLKKQQYDGYTAVPSIAGKEFERQERKLSRDPKQMESMKILRSKYNILLAEDNLINQKVALRIITDSGYNIQPVSNGIEALNIVKDNFFDLILMDVQMPEMDGFTATKEIRGLNNAASKVPIIAITAHALIGDKEKCLKAGMNDYVSKPIVPEQLIKILDKWLNIEQGMEKDIKQERVQTEAVFDFDVLDRMSGGDKEFQKDLLSSYILDVTERFERLEKFVELYNIEKIIGEAHTIKGASYSVGSKKIGDEALGIEISGKHNDLANINQRMENLKNAISTTKEILKNYIT